MADLSSLKVELQDLLAKVEAAAQEVDSKVEEVVKDTLDRLGLLAPPPPAPEPAPEPAPAPSAPAEEAAAPVAEEAPSDTPEP